MTKPTAEEFLLAAEVLHPDPDFCPVVMSSDAKYYGDMRAAEERERIKAAHVTCGYALYGPPADCACGVCPEEGES